jgi:hypothetical protein
MVKVNKKAEQKLIDETHSLLQSKRSKNKGLSLRSMAEMSVNHILSKLQGDGVFCPVHSDQMYRTHTGDMDKVYSSGAQEFSDKVVLTKTTMKKYHSPCGCDFVHNETIEVKEYAVTRKVLPIPASEADEVNCENDA